MRKFSRRLDRRILLTRDRKLADRRDLGATAVLVVGSDESREQLWEVVAHFGLRLSASEFMMRCSVCNGRGYLKSTKQRQAGGTTARQRCSRAWMTFTFARRAASCAGKAPKSQHDSTTSRAFSGGLAPSHT